MSKHLVKLILVVFVTLGLQACAADGSGGCFKLHCTKEELADANKKKQCLNGQTMDKFQLPSEIGSEKVGVVSYLTITIRHEVMKSSKKIFEKIINNDGFKNLVKAAMALFVIMYAIAITLGIANPSPAELVVRGAKMAMIFFLLTSWDNFNDDVVEFFEAFVDSLTNIMTSAVTGADIQGNDVMSFIDTKVLGYLFSVKFAVTIGAVATATANGAGLIIAPLIMGILLSYLWSLVMGVQIYLLSTIARALLYAVAPIFLIFILFQQTKALFDGWLKQLMNFSLQPVLLISFMAFFNGVFFNYLDNLFKDNYRVCFTQTPTTGQAFELSNFTFQTLEDGKEVSAKQVTQTMNIFNLFVTMILAMTMVKMNQWVVASASQLTEGGLSFQGTMGNFQKAQSAISSAFSDMAKKTFDVPGGKK